MVCLHGRSRSASVVMAGMMMQWGVPARAAASILRHTCPSIDWRLCFPEQLTSELTAIEGSAAEVHGMCVDAPTAEAEADTNEFALMASMGLPTAFSGEFRPPVSNHE